MGKLGSWSWCPVKKLFKRVTITLLLGCFISMSMPPLVSANEQISKEVSLNEAVALALIHSESVKKAEKEIKRTEELRDYSYQSLSYVPTAPDFTAQVEVPWYQMLTADLTWQMSKKAYTVQQDVVALDTCKKYWDLLQAQDKVTANESALNKTRRQLQDARAAYRVGTLAFPAVLAAETQYNIAVTNSTTAKNDLDKAYEVLNRALGFHNEDRPVLTDEVVFKPLEVNDLNYEVKKILDACPSIWLAQEKVTMQKQLQQMSYYTGAYRPYEVRQIEVEQVQLDAVSTEQMFEELTKSLYYGVKSLEGAYTAAQEGLRLAEDNLRITKIKLEVGMATEGDVKSALADVANAKNMSNGLAFQHAYMKLSFAKPWAYVSGGQ